MLQPSAGLCYKSPMTKPPTSVRSIRLPDQEWARLQAEADAAGLSVNALVARKVSYQPAGEGGGTPDREKPSPHKRPAGASDVEPSTIRGSQKRTRIHVSVPLAGTFERKATPKGGKK